MPPLKRYLNWILLISGVILLLIALAGFLPRNFSFNQNNVEMTVTAQPGMVFAPGQCLLLNWSVGNIQTIFLNSDPTTGDGQARVCIDPSAPPVFAVTYADGDTSTYTLAIPVLLNQPLFWLGLVLIGAGILTGRKPRTAETTEESEVRSSVWRNAALMLFSVVVTLGLLEIGLRYLIANSDNQDAQIMYLYSLDDIRRLDDRLIPMPYVNYLPAPEFPDHNVLGYRGEEIELPKPDGVYRIVALGGSTTYSTGTTAEESYPALLQNILRDDYGLDHVEVINGGFVGYSSWETVANMAFRVLELEPDHIIHYAAINDLVPREQVSVDCYRGENVLRGINGARGFWTESSRELSPSALHRFIGINLGWLDNPLALQSAFNLPRADCQNDGGIPIEERVERNQPVYFERNLRSLIGVAQAHDVNVLLSTWVYYVDAEHPAYWRDAIAEHNAITQAVAAEMNQPLIDLAAEFPVNGEYWEIDGVHMLAAGTRQQAQRYAAFLVENELIPALNFG